MKKFSQHKNYYSKIEFTHIRPDITIEGLKEFCEIAKKKGYYAVCVRSKFVNDAKSFLDDSNVKVVTVIDFPEVEGAKIGETKSRIKLKEVRESIINGTDEIDVAINTKSFVKAEDKTNIIKDLTQEIGDISNYCSSNGVLIKIVLETGNLLLDDIKQLCEICVKAGVHFVMTSTGYSKVGAELDKVKYMRRILPDYIKIKAAGGIRTSEMAEEFLKYADRIGTSTEL